jgi:prevent-host-death family protein
VKLSESVKPISYFKAHASEVLNDVASRQKTIVITQNGEAKAVLQDIRVYEETQESLALLKILSMSQKNLERGLVKPVEKAFEDLRNKTRQRRSS